MRISKQDLAGFKYLNFVQRQVFLQYLNEVTLSINIMKYLAFSTDIINNSIVSSIVQ